MIEYAKHKFKEKQIPYALVSDLVKDSKHMFPWLSHDRIMNLYRKQQRELEVTVRGAWNLEETKQGDLEVTFYDSDNLDDLEDSRNSIVDLRDNLEDSRDHKGEMLIQQDPPTICVSDHPK